MKMKTGFLLFFCGVVIKFKTISMKHSALSSEDLIVWNKSSDDRAECVITILKSSRETTFYNFNIIRERREMLCHTRLSEPDGERDPEALQLSASYDVLKLFKWSLFFWKDKLYLFCWENSSSFVLKFDTSLYVMDNKLMAFKEIELNSK